MHYDSAIVCLVCYSAINATAVTLFLQTKLNSEKEKR